MQKTIIFDLDGTLANIDKRREKSLTKFGRINWAEFFKPDNIQLDEPKHEVIEMFKLLKQNGYRVGIFSGRDAISRTETEKWLSDYGIEYDFLHMRPENTKTPDVILKKTWLERELKNGHEIFCVFDDRDSVVDMWRSEGIQCFQVNYGNF